jgi:Flp pilus assembly CpaE family ATPase
VIDIVLCASGSEEVRIVHDLAMDRSRPARVVRRCADLTETLAVVSAGIGDVVLIDLSVRGLSRDAVATMLRSGAVIGLRSREEAEGTTVGLRHVLSADAPIDEILAAVTAAVSGEEEHADWVQEADPAPEQEPGRLVAVWGPSGAPGRSTVAANLAAEAALTGCGTVLVDADTYGPSLSQLLGVLDEAPGLVAAARAHDRDTLTAETLGALLPTVQPGLRLLSGIGVPGRWAELRRGALDGVWGALRRRGELVVADIASVLEEDEELSYDTAAPVSITRLLRDQGRLEELGVEELHVVVNRVGAPVPGERIRELIASRMRVDSLHLLPDDPVACRTAVWDGALLSEAAPRSPLRRALRDLAASLLVPSTAEGEPSAARV